MRWVACVATPICRTNVRNDGFRVLSLDFEGGAERVFGVYDNPVRLSFQLEPDGKMHRHASSFHGSAARFSPMSMASQYNLCAGNRTRARYNLGSIEGGKA
jgi:hypothetical protein